jgi:hypothetical protein
LIEDREIRRIERLSAAPSVLRISIRFLSGAIAPAIKRLQRTVARASKLARPPAADPQHRYICEDSYADNYYA